MPCIGYVCPPGAPTAGERHEVTHCLSLCKNPCASPPLIAAIHHANAINHHKGAYISASMIAGGNCLRRIVWERYDTQGYFQPLRNVYWAFRGTMAHQVIEDRGGLTDGFGWMREIRMSVPLVFPDHPAPVFDDEGEWTGDYDTTQPLAVTLGGTCDAYNPYRRMLHDFKTMADMKVAKVLGGDQQESWVTQLNVYRWLISQTRVSPEQRKAFAELGLPPLPGEFFPAPSELAIQAIGMMELPLTGTTYAVKTRGRQVTHELPHIPVWDLELTEAGIRATALTLYRALVQRIPQPVVAKELAWLCGSCPFNGETNPGERCHPTNEREALTHETSSE